MKRDSFILYADAYDSIRSLTDAQKGQLLDMIFCFCRDEKLPETDQIVSVVFSFIQRTLERDARKYEKRCEKARMAARMRWDANACERIPSNAKNADNDPDPDPVPDNKKSTLSGTCPRQADGPSNCPHQKIVDLWNETLPELPQVKIVSEARKKSIRARWREDKQRQNVDWWKGFFEYIRTCSFLMGASNSNDRAFELTFDWMLKPRNFVKIVEGNYVDR